MNTQAFDDMDSALADRKPGLNPAHGAEYGLNPAQTAVERDTPTPESDIGKFARIRLKIRDKKSELKKAFDAEYARLTEQENQIGAFFLAKSQELGIDKFTVEGVATVFFVETMKVTGSDWAAFGAFLQEGHDPLEFMEKRVSSTAVKEYMKRHEGMIPPGISIFKQLETRVRRAGEKE